MSHSEARDTDQKDKHGKLEYDIYDISLLALIVSSESSSPKQAPPPVHPASTCASSRVHGHTAGAQLCDEWSCLEAAEVLAIQRPLLERL